MRNNIKVAETLLAMSKGGSVITTHHVAETAGVHYNEVSSYLVRWRAAGWLTATRHGQRTLHYSITKAGITGLTGLINRHGDDRDVPWH